MTRYHKTNLGSFGGGLVVDINGYTYTTAAEWLSDATLDGISQSQLDADPEYAEEWAEEQADAARQALDAAESGLAEWREANV